MRAMDKGLANSKVGIVLVTPALLRRLPAEGIPDIELSALLARELLVPVVHETTYTAKTAAKSETEVSPMDGIGERYAAISTDSPRSESSITSRTTGCDHGGCCRF